MDEQMRECMRWMSEEYPKTEDYIPEESSTTKDVYTFVNIRKLIILWDDYFKL